MYSHSGVSLNDFLKRNNSIILDTTSSKFKLIYSYFLEQVKMGHIDHNTKSIKDFKTFIHDLGVEYWYLSKNPLVDNIDSMQLQWS